MKKTRSVRKKTDPPGPFHAVRVSDQTESTLTQESNNLSPERISDGVNSTTPLLNEILAQSERFYQLRSWAR